MDTPVLYLKHETLRVYTALTNNKLIYGQTASGATAILNATMREKNQMVQEPVALLIDNVLYKRLRFVSNQFVASQVMAVVNEEIYRKQYDLREVFEYDEHSWEALMGNLVQRDAMAMSSVTDVLGLALQIEEGNTITL